MAPRTAFALVLALACCNWLSCAQKTLDLIVPLPLAGEGAKVNAWGDFNAVSTEQYRVKHFRISLPGVHGYKRGGRSEGYEDDTIQVQSLFSHINKQARGGAALLYSNDFRLKELKIGEGLTLNADRHRNKHLFVEDLLKPGVVLVATRYTYNADHQMLRSDLLTKQPKTESGVPSTSLYQTFVEAALHFRNELDLRTAIFALDKAVEMGGEEALQHTSAIKNQISNFKKHFQKVTKTYESIEPFLAEIVFDGGFFEDMMLSAVYLNKNGHVAQFYEQMDRVCSYYKKTTFGKTKGNSAAVKVKQLLQSRFRVLLFTANMFDELISMFEKYLDHGQQYIDMGVAYDSLGQFHAGATYHTKAYKLLKRKITQSALDRYSKSITGYARYYFAIKDMINNEKYKNKIEGVSIIDEAATLQNMDTYDLYKTGFKVLSTQEVSELEKTIKHFQIFNRDHVDRRLESKLSKEQFDTEYAQHGRPVLIRMDDSNSFAQTFKQWKRTSLLSRNSKYKDLYFDVSKSSEIAPSQNFAVDKDTLRRIGAKRTKVKDYIDLYLLQNGSLPHFPNHDPPYLFSTDKGQMIRDIEVPKYFQGTERYELNSRARDQKALFYIGAAGTNTYFHQHATAYNFLTAGRKKWFLLPPSANIGPTVATLPWWIEHVLPRLKIKPIECIQHPGEILFIPNGWFHAVYNIDEVVGIAFEIGHDKRIPDVASGILNFKRKLVEEDTDGWL